MPKKIVKKVKQAKEVKQVVVRSHAYGDHIRSARGSIKPALLNEALAAKAKNISTINSIASEVHRFLKLHAGTFKESMLWQKMLSRMHCAVDMTPFALLETLVGLELNSRYPLTRFGSLSVLIKLQGNTLTLQALNKFIPRFKGKIDMYCYDVIVLFFSGKGKAVGDVSVSTKWVDFNESINQTVFNVTVPKRSKFYMVCLRVQGRKGEVVVEELSGVGVKVIKVRGY